MFYRTCTHCGAHLDPGEKCDCQRQKTAVDRLRETYRPSKETTREEALWHALGLVRK